jgi:c(7)-type cytochrome triheme protein
MRAPSRIEENTMRTLIAAGTMIAFALATGAIVAEDKKPPEKVTYDAKPGPVTFDHAKHVEKLEKDCKACHDAIFPQAKAPLNYKAAMHKTAETEKKSCGACHVAGGKAFESKGNCQKCHEKKSA